LIFGTSTRVALYDQYAVIVVSVIDASGDDHSVYVINYSMQS
jgi:hypothetical protein